MTSQKSGPPVTNHIEVVIIGSMTLGPSSLTAQGFEWSWNVGINSLAPIIEKMQAMEAGWGDLIRQWQAEGAMGDDVVEITPGALIWLVNIETPILCVEKIERNLGQVAEKIGSCTPHVAIEFTERTFDAHSLASEVVKSLQQVVPTPYRLLTEASANKHRARKSPVCIARDQGVVAGDV